MTADASKWVDKAEADFAAAVLLRRSRKMHSRDIVCFHLQQCIEKLLKARLIEAGIAFPRTHDLERLLNLVLSVEPLWEVMRPGIVQMVGYAVEIRYPGYDTSPKEATQLLKIARNLRVMIRGSLGLRT